MLALFGYGPYDLGVRTAPPLFTTSHGRFVRESIDAGSLGARVRPIAFLLALPVAHWIRPDSISQVNRHSTYCSLGGPCIN